MIYALYNFCLLIFTTILKGKLRDFGS